LQQDLFPDQEPSQAGAQAEISKLSECQQQVLQMVGYEAVTLDELVQLSALPVARLTAELSCLELQELITRCAGGYIRK
jgi:predicted Rossmann fold nucleotide-binding protein DprA/Smf involved in DNA uptake